MIFNNRRIDIPALYINGNEIEIVNTFKFLDFYLYSRLTHRDHFGYIRSRLSSFMYINFRLRHYLSFEAAKTFYFWMIQSILCFGLVVWGGSLLESTCFDRLKLLQDKIVFNLFSLPCHSTNDISSIYNRAGILKLEDLYRVMTSKLMFNILFEDSIPFLKQRFDDLILTDNYETRGANHLVNFFSNY